MFSTGSGLSEVWAKSDQSADQAAKGKSPGDINENQKEASMRRATEMMYVSVACCVAVILTSASEFCVGQSGITFSEVAGQHEVRYVSGTTVYIEKLLKHRWVGSFWGVEGNIRQINPGLEQRRFRDPN
jgi:hypothetical protein